MYCVKCYITLVHILIYKGSDVTFFSKLESLSGNRILKTLNFSKYKKEYALLPVVIFCRTYFGPCQATPAFVT